MISFDFEYGRPSTVREAVDRFREANARGKRPLYYSGGTEIISVARLDLLQPGAVIDIKAIPECNVMEIRQEELVVGAAVTLTAMEEAGLFPLFGATVRDLADHTNRNKITVGGNLCGGFVYREALLPFLLADSRAVVAGPAGVRSMPIHSLFNGGQRLPRGELLVQIVTGRRYLDLPYVTVKKTKMERIDYPLVRVAALRTSEGIRAAFSGVSAAAFRSLAVEKALNDDSLPPERRVDKAISVWPMPILSDILGSAAYRKFVLRHTLTDTMEALERRPI